MDRSIIINGMEQNCRIICRLNEMRSDERKCSFKIKVGDQTILAHRDILMGSSRYFEAMISHDTLEYQKGEVHLHDVDYECVRICIDSIYGEQISIPQDKFEDMLFATQLMQLDSLFSVIEESLMKAVSAENIIESLNTAILFSCRKLQLACERFAAKNFRELMDMGIFNDIDTDFIITIFQSEDIKISEQEKLDFLISWVKLDIARESIMTSLLETICLQQVAVGYRRYLIEKEDLIKNNLRYTQVITASIMDTMGVKSIRNSEYNILIFDQIKTSLLLFDPVKNEINDTPFKRISIDGHFSVAVLDCQIYMLGKDRSVYTLTWIDRSAVWQTNPDMLHDHGQTPPVTTAEGFLYVIGGSGKCFSDTVERYSPEVNRWEMCRCKDSSISGATVVTFEDSIYSIGGRVNKNVVKATEKFDINQEKWTFVSKMNEKREGASVTVWKNTIMVAGGFQGSNVLKSVEQYNKHINQWTLLRSMRIPRGLFQLYSINDVPFAFGGRNDEYAKSSVEKYNSKKRIWEQVVLPDTVSLKIYRTILVEKG